MDAALETVVKRCRAALASDDPQASVVTVMQEAVRDPAIAAAIAPRTQFTDMMDVAIHRSDELTMLAAAMPPGLTIPPHNHNLWSVVGVCSGQEDNRFYERDGGSLREVGQISVTGPGVLANAADVIHSISNPLDSPMLVLHAYGGDLLGIERSLWDPETNAETTFDPHRTVNP